MSDGWRSFSWRAAARLVGFLVAGALGTLISGCQMVGPITAASPQMFQDALFAPPTDKVDAADIFALTPAMHAFVDNQLHHGFRLDRRQALVDALSTKTQLKIEYDSSTTRTASEAFAARSGNCMSLVLMTAALAKDLGLTVRYRNVF